MSKFTVLSALSVIVFKLLAKVKEEKASYEKPNKKLNIENIGLPNNKILRGTE